MRESLFLYGRKRWCVWGVAASPLLIPTPGGTPVYNSWGTPWFARIQQLKWNGGKASFCVILACFMLTEYAFENL